MSAALHTSHLSEPGRAEASTTRDAGPHSPIRLSVDPAILAAAANDEADLAVWKRAAPDYVPSLADLSAEALPRLRATVFVSDVARAVGEACGRAGMPEGPDRADLIADIASLARRMAALFQAERLAIRLDAGSGQTCPKWHRDAVTARLLCALHGTGTEYAIASGDEEPKSVDRLDHGHVGLFRGKASSWSAGDAMVVHRSPRLAPGERRLLLVIDPIADSAA